MRGRCFYQRISTLLVAVLIFQMAACGTLLYPERRGQKTGQIDVGVAVLDGIGLLFFILPGVVAFAVDFATGAIFLPSGAKQSPLFSPRKAAVDFSVVYADPSTLNRETIEAIVSEQIGRPVSLKQPDIVISKLKDQQAFIREYERWALNETPTHLLGN